MKVSGNTILVTGGSAGIGFEIAKRFSENDNQVIITGRDEDRLTNAMARLKNVVGIKSDITDSQQAAGLVERLAEEFPRLNVVVNNAGRASVHFLNNSVNAYDNASAEIMTNYLSVVRLNAAVLPLLSKQPFAAVVNVSSIVAFAPGIATPTYSASKAALHSYSQSLRYSLNSSGIRVFELMPPLVNTEFSHAIGGKNGVDPKVVAADLMAAMEADQYEIHVGQTAQMYKLFLSSPQEALNVINAGIKLN